MSDRGRTSRNRRFEHDNSITKTSLPFIITNNINFRQGALAYRAKLPAGLPFVSRIVLWHRELPAKDLSISFLRYRRRIVDLCRLVQDSHPETRRKSRDNQGLVDMTNRDRTMYA